jgi:hypothetical protein
MDACATIYFIRGKNLLALASIRKVPSAKDAKALLPSVLLNARSDAGDVRIVEQHNYRYAARRRNRNPLLVPMQTTDTSTFGEAAISAQPTTGGTASLRVLLRGVKGDYCPIAAPRRPQVR